MFLGNHSADLLNFGRSQTASLVSRPKFSKNYESTTAITSIVLRKANQSAKNPSLRDSAFFTESNFPLPCGGG
ncbi:hypothetical protein [Helicobacter sp. 23-1045]